MHCFITAKVRPAWASTSPSPPPPSATPSASPTSPSASASQSPPRPSSAVCSLHNYALQRPLSATAATDTSAQSAGLPRLVPCCPTLPRSALPCPVGVSLAAQRVSRTACLVSRIKQFSAWFALFACACHFSSLRSPFPPSVSTPPSPSPFSIAVANRPTLPTLTKNAAKILRCVKFC